MIEFFFFFYLNNINLYQIIQVFFLNFKINLNNELKMTHRTKTWGMCIDVILHVTSAIL